MSERVEAAAAAMWDQRPMIRLEDGSPKPFSDVRTQYPYRDRYTRQAEAALAAADAVMFSDEAVERAAKAMFADEQCDRLQKLDVDGNWQSRLRGRDRDEYRRLVRVVAAALMGAGNE